MSKDDIHDQNRPSLNVVKQKRIIG